MQKNILISILLTVFTLGLYGCSCSQSSKASHNLAPGLYLSKLSVLEDSSAEAVIRFTVKLERENSEEVTVNYAITAIDPDGRSAEEIADFAIVGADTIDPEVDVVSNTGTITFVSGGSSEVQTEVEIVADTIYEHDESFLITLSAASAGVNIVQASIEAVIVNDDSIPVISMDTPTYTIAEAFSGIGFAAGVPSDPLSNAELTFTLDAVSRVDASVIVSGLGLVTETTNAAGHQIDYILVQGTDVLYLNRPVVIPAGDTSVVISVKAIDDGLAEGTEGFQLTMGATIDTVFDRTNNKHKVSFLVTDNDVITKVSPVNDTGLLQIVFWLTAANEAEVDANHGVDSTLPAKIGGGRAGFDYSRYDTNGNLVASAEPNYFNADGKEVVPWECVKDNVSGLVWEVKALFGVRYVGHNYFWYDPNEATNGGNEGASGYGICVAGSSLLKECNTSYYVAEMNKAKLCGMTGWRLPTIEELRTLVDYGISAGNDEALGQRDITYDTAYFAGDVLASKFTWSSTTDAQSPSRARTIRFRTSSFLEESRSKGSSSFATIRLVNDSLLLAQ